MNIDVADILRALEVDERVDETGGRVVQGECETVRERHWERADLTAAVRVSCHSVGASAAVGDACGRQRQPLQRCRAVKHGLHLADPNPRQV